MTRIMSKIAPLNPLGRDRFEDNILTLRNYSFISVNIDKTTFEIHGLVQLAMREWLSAHRQLER